MNKQQKWESKVIRKQMRETGYSYKKVKRLIVKAVFNNSKKSKKLKHI